MKLMQLIHEDVPVLETINETSQVIETEIVVYAKINNFDGLQKATQILQHEQMESSFKNGVRCRVRKEVKDNESTYEFTYKIKTSEAEGYEANREYTATVDKDFFEGFKEVAEHRLVKTRYEFESDTIQLLYGEGEDKTIIEVPNIKYEVDVYTDQAGEVCEWCKIDIEIDPLLDYLNQHHSDLENIKLNVKITHLSFEPSDAILTTAMTDEQKSFVDSLWHDHYHLKPMDDATVDDATGTIDDSIDTAVADDTGDDQPDSKEVLP